MKKVLVLYYSRSGNTQRLARAIAAALGADFEPIVETRARRGIRGWMRSGFEARTKRLTSIEPPLHELRRYDLVVLGTPTWASAPSSPVRTLVAQRGAELRSVAFFCTCAERGAEGTLRELSSLSGKAPVDVLALTEHELRGDYAPKLDRFVRELRRSLEPAAAA